jgi:hypothetical protein
VPKLRDPLLVRLQLRACLLNKVSSPPR